MTLRQLRYFVEVARCGSLTRAAQILAIAQPALSQNIAALEQALQTRLFERHAKGVALSAAGQRLYERAVDLLGSVDELKHEVAGAERRPSGRVRLSVAGSIAGVLAAPLLKRVGEHYPKIDLLVVDGLSSEIRAQVEARQADMALMPGALEIAGCETLPVFEEHFQFYGASARMHGMPEQLGFAELARCRLAAPDRAHDLRKLLERAADAADQAIALHSISPLPAFVILGLAGGMVNGTYAFLLADLFPTAVRFGGVTLALNLATACSPD